MWPFKKRVEIDKPKKEKEVLPEYDISGEDRFRVVIKKDNNEYYIEILDWWSKLLHVNEKGKKKNTMHSQNSTMQEVKDYKEVLKNIEKMKDDLRKQFIEKRKIQCRPEKGKEIKHKTKEEVK